MSRVMIITGTRKGIGRFLAESYLAAGDVVYGCSRRASDLEHPHYHHTCLNVADEKAVTTFVRDVYKKEHRIDALINNAGAASMNAFVLTPYATAKRVMETNFAGTFLFSREVSKYMIKARKGCIVNYSTVAVALQLEGELIYSASKAAVEQLTHVLAKEIGTFGITVNAIGPTPIDTDLIKNVPKEKIANLMNQQCIKRLGTFQDVKNAIDFYLRPESDFITGQVLYLGGVN
ncbi:SDR family NAD(P)-dependent oxidoreductase [Selenomonas bovis]|uniref:SDR family NAD(P)-dependent oxidoreductase n=1 Tax=Selenomonas bovis TaxID=416586 RepID=UPI00036AC570|nr:SDR family oxidoreductase [Selenomonas bovis]